MKVVWSADGDESLAAILDDLRRFSESTAESWGQRISAKVELAAVFPMSHRVVPEIGEPSIREVFVDPYRIWFRVLDDHFRS